MKFWGLTIDRLIKFHIIQGSFILIAIISLLLWFFSTIDILIGFWVSIIGVFLGVIFGFYYNESDKRIGIYNKQKRIMELFEEELKDNNRKLPQLFLNKGEDWITCYLNNAVWRVYENDLGDLEKRTFNKLDKIYYKINVINMGIEKYSGDLKVNESLLNQFRGERDNIKKEISDFLLEYKDHYPKQI